MISKSRKLYKYISPEHVGKVFQSTNIATLKCSLPKDYNDPYELFLTIDFHERPDVLAYYADAIGDLPQLPTICFSRSPIVIPMWAHYASSHQGFVVELAEDDVARTLPQSRFDDVRYSDAPSENLSDLLHRAYEIGKPRYTYLLQAGVFDAAYFTKASCWNYEQERRMVVSPPDTRTSGELTLLDVQSDHITSIICGARASEETRKTLREKAEEFDCRYLELRIGRSAATPFFVDGDGETLAFDAGEIGSCKQCCEECGEPTAIDAFQCSWCQIDDELKEIAASKNPYRILNHLGLLQGYIDGMDKVGQKKKK